MKGKKIELKDLTSSPYFVIGIMSLVCVLILGIIVTLIMNIDTTKDAIVETGLLVKVPLFIEQGEKVWVKTEDGSYDSRAN